jgi:hypothetical protein
MHYAILNQSGNALGWFTSEVEGRRALAEMVEGSPEADLDLVAFDGSGRPAEPISASVRSAWPVARLVLSTMRSRVPANSASPGAINIGNTQVNAKSENATDDRVPDVDTWRRTVSA